MREGFFLLIERHKMSYFGPDSYRPTLYDEKQGNCLIYTDEDAKKRNEKKRKEAARRGQLKKFDKEAEDRKKGICYGPIYR